MKSGLHARLSGPTVGCPDAWMLAEFYSSLLGWSIVDRSDNEPGGWAVIRSPSGTRKIEFQREEPFAPPVWPTAEGSQQMGMHLDIAVHGLTPFTTLDGFDDLSEDEQARALTVLEAEVEQRNREMVELGESVGARVAEHQPQWRRGVVVMLDPAGHPFCLFPDDGDWHAQ